MIEYWIPATVFATALLSRNLNLMTDATWGKNLIVAACFLLALSYTKTIKAKLIIDSGNNPDKFKEISDFLALNTEQDEIIANLYWDDFPFLYFHNPKNRYLTGLDPNFLYYASPKKSRLLEALIQNPEVLTKIDKIVTTEFQSRYLITHTENKEVFLKSPGLTLQLETPEGILWKVKEDS